MNSLSSTLNLLHQPWYRVDGVRIIRRFLVFYLSEIAYLFSSTVLKERYPILSFKVMKIWVDGVD